MLCAAVVPEGDRAWSPSHPRLVFRIVGQLVEPTQERGALAFAHALDADSEVPVDVNNPLTRDGMGSHDRMLDRRKGLYQRVDLRGGSAAPDQLLAKEMPVVGC